MKYKRREDKNVDLLKNRLKKFNRINPHSLKESRTSVVIDKEIEKERNSFF